ncbi:MAG TPA: SMC-Scp complex subunit ScpB [Fimbriiglobus sp.]|nr:SMC-Scp complex subunit ScpB [Fimbriiglobus sp.]
MPTPDQSPLDLGRAAAARLGADWQLEAEPDPASEGRQPPEEPPAPPTRTRGTYVPRSPGSSGDPPPPDRIVEALLFVGGPPLTPEAVAAAVRGITPDRFREAIDRLNKSYRAQNRPYSIQPRDSGYILALKPGHHGVREKLFGGPREARLSQPALDVLSLVAYRQPVTKADVDALRGADSGAVLRQLVRLGLVAVARRGDVDDRQVCYGTAPRFLELFGLSSLDELPRLSDPGPR